MIIGHKGLAKASLKLTVCAAAILSACAGAEATDGYFQYGFGARQGALGDLS